MDEDIKPLLAQIAEQLKIRNKLIQRQQEEAEKMRSEFLGGNYAKGRSELMEQIRESAMSRFDDHDKIREGIRKAADEDREERRRFQAALLAELSTLNANFAKLFKHLRADKPE